LLLVPYPSPPGLALELQMDSMVFADGFRYDGGAVKEL
jgi:hypothetical protein